MYAQSVLLAVVPYELDCLLLHLLLLLRSGLPLLLPEEAHGGTIAHEGAVAIELLKS